MKQSQKRDYTEIVERCGKIRHTINQELYGRMKKLSKLFQAIWGEEHSTFKLVNDSLYYQGGWPSESTPPRLHSHLDKVGKLFKYYEAMGLEDEINAYLKDKYGLEVSRTEEYKPVTDRCMSPSVAMELMMELFPGEYREAMERPMTDMMFSLFSEGMDLQREICGLADRIKIMEAREVKEKFDIEKDHFVTAVSIKAKEIKGTAIDRSVIRVEKDVESMTKSIAPFIDDRS